ncbi:MAG: hypothetical protein F6K31_20730 [Symploca sp. SIO2G7]|nr:hypothetical protein [Symploca sp. SIO2G7]
MSRRNEEIFRCLSFVICHLSFVICHLSLGNRELGIGNWKEARKRILNSHLAPVHKYLIGSVTTINSNAETIKSYHCCQMSR